MARQVHPGRDGEVYIRVWREARFRRPASMAEMIAWLVIALVSFTVAISAASPRLSVVQIERP